MASSGKPGEIVAAQCRAARALLGWSVAELAARTSLPSFSVADFEQKIRLVSAETLAVIRFAFEDAGIEFVGEKRDGYGVMLRKDETDRVSAEGLGKTPDSSAQAMLPG